MSLLTFAVKFIRRITITRLYFLLTVKIILKQLHFPHGDKNSITALLILHHNAICYLNMAKVSIVIIIPGIYVYINVKVLQEQQ